MTRLTPRRIPLAAAAVLSSLGALAAPAAGQDRASGNPVHSNRETFRIPFAASAADLAAAGATEARLLVSTDAGRRWEEAGSAAPGAGGFQYSAPADGDYWFSVLTVDAQGMPAPADVAIVPQLHVRMDRVAPTVQVGAAPAGDGTVAVRWNVADPDADPAALRVTFTPEGGAGQRVPVTPALSGSFRIPAQRAGGSVTISVADRAGNVGTATCRTGGSAAPVSYTQQADYGAGAVERASGSLSAPHRPAGLSNEPRSPAPVPPSVSPRLPAAPSAGAQARRHDVGFGGASPSAGASALKNRSFKIGYAVDAVGSSGVGAVDVFITPDGGQHWYSYGQDVDRVSPAEISVPGDGDYGFCVRVRSGAGLAPAPPRNGEAPDVRVTVDGTPPTVDLLSAGQGRGAEANTLSLEWRAADNRPGAVPVRVELADSAGGPWEVVQDWGPDSGSAVVPLRPGRSANGGRVFVRVSARDDAGNEGSAVTPHGVAVDLVRPSARVLGVVR
ncbi:hypothetical protein [Alienimonas californiensis]|uniref:Ser-Thr-rich glycosyl-phosphatidyl-inositol-anchored membrane family protein n=1 Tax=Alienimonas californiensis TaxID=2527989 RepID=A0A517PCE2_9PLAN|nr:hypothetical protein [Alienimonas californiensis]QDT17011.1 hypothetical protein CA12_31210 [Alienimonas californiensis]